MSVSEECAVAAGGERLASPSGADLSDVECLLQEREHLEACKSSTERSLLHLSQEIVETSQRTLQNALRENADVRLPIFRQVAYQLDGDCSIGKGWCRITLPFGSHRPQ